MDENCAYCGKPVIRAEMDYIEPARNLTRPEPMKVYHRDCWISYQAEIELMEQG